MADVLDAESRRVVVNYYNEIDKSAVAWLKNLISTGLIPAGDVDDRSIKDVKGSDLEGYTQCHFFAGIGGWSEALRLANWPSTKPVWTGSCPCQSLSVAGLGKGAKDERHLWPEFCRLIAECEPPIVFGEQVASKLGREWLAGVRLDLEEMGYAVGAADLCAASINAPHIRQRLWWVADSNRTGQKAGQLDGQQADRCGEERGTTPDHKPEIEKFCSSGGLGDTLQSGGPTVGQEQARLESSNYWANSTFIPCGDGKARRIESGSVCLVDGVSFRLADGRTRKGASRVNLLKGFGNAIVPQLGAEFIRALMKEGKNVNK